MLWKLEVVNYWESLEKGTQNCEYMISVVHILYKKEILGSKMI